MARTSVSIQSGAFLNGAQTISAQYFGGNILFDRDKLGDAGTYDEKAAALNLGLIRYPGGDVTEKYFDISDPNRTDEPAGHSGALLPLSDYLDYIAATGAKGSLVAPTVSFMDGLATGSMTKGQVRAEIREFLTNLKAGVYGDASNIDHIEIGNEYYGYEKYYAWSAVDEYARIAPIWAKEIRKVFGDDVDIAVQGGVNADDNAVFIDAFQGKGALIDSVIYHSYPWDLGQIYTHDTWKSWLWSPWSDAGLTENVFLSEWGVSNQRLDETGALITSDLVEDGLARAIAMVEMASMQIRSGVDFAAVWPVQQNTRGDLGGNEGQTAENSPNTLSEDGLTLAGEAFQLMSESLPGAKMLDVGGAIDLDGKAESDRFAPELLVRAFEDDTKIIVFASAWALDDDVGLATLNLKLGGKFTSYDVTTLTVAGENYTDPNADPVTIEQTGLDPSGGVTINFARDYELQRLIFHKDPAMGLGAVSPNDFGGVAQKFYGDAQDEKLMGENGVADGVWGRGGDDRLFGLGAGDKLVGGLGDDSLFGGPGFDVLRGGVGVDRLYGGAGTDVLAGAAGDDRMLGQNGEDTLKGGGGADTLIGGRQNDVLNGGGGDDVLNGGAGDDVLTGAAGADNLYGGAGADLIRGGAGADRLNGGQGADTLQGGAGDDVIETGPGADLIYGDAGADVFVIRASHDGATIMDFEDGMDQFLFSQVDRFADLTITATADGVEVSGGGASFLLDGVAAGVLDAHDFLF